MNVKAEDTTPTEQGESYTEEEELSPQEKARRAAAERQAALQQELDNSPKENTNDTWQAVDKVTRPVEPAKEETEEPVEPADAATNGKDQEAEEDISKNDSKDANEENGAVKEYLLSTVTLADGTTFNFQVSEELVGSNARVVVKELDGNNSAAFAEKVGLTDIYDGRYYVVTLYDENNQEVNGTYTVSMSNVAVDGDKVYVYGAQGTDYTAFVEDQNNEGSVAYTFESTQYNTFVVLTTKAKPAFRLFAAPAANSNPLGERNGDTADGLLGMIDPEGVERIDITATKVWKDGNNRDGKRANVTLTLEGSITIDGKKKVVSVASQTHTPDDTEFNFEGTKKKPRYHTEDGVQYEIDWELKEDAIEGYTTEITKTPDNDGNIHFTVTNTHTPETVVFNVDVVWHDKDESTRPSYVKVAVYKNGSSTAERTRKVNAVAGEDVWSFEINADKQYKYENGKEIEYDLKEKWDDAVAKAKYDTKVENLGDGKYQIHNYLKPAKLTLTIEKIWDDNNNLGELRPDEVTFNIVGKAGIGGDAVVNETLTVTEADGWKGTIELPRSYDDMLVLYDITEEDILGYVELDPATDYNWIAVPASDPEDLYTDTEGTLQITNRPELVEINVEKVWDDNNNEADARPDGVHIRVFRNDVYIRNYKLSDRNQWKATITGKDEDPFFKYDKDGNEYEYRVEESYKAVGTGVDSVPIPNYELVSNEGSVKDGFTITNRYVPEFTTVTIQKVWDDDESTSRPNVYVRLVNNGVMVRDAYLNSTTDPAWSATFTDIPVFDAAGNEIDYKVEEEAIPGYITPLIEKEGNALHGYTFTITNANRTSVKVNKVWEDDDNRDGIRPETVTVNLLTDGTPVDSVELSESNEWKYEFKDLPRYVDNQPVTYTVEEVNIEGYESELSGDAKTGFTIINTHSPEIYETISVTKVWKDGENRDGLRPETIYARLYKGDVYAGKQQALNENNEWAGVFKTSFKTPLYVYENGQKIEYTIVESTKPSGDPIALEKYDVTVEGDAEQGFTVTNTHAPELVEFEVTKVWEDEDDADGFRPDEVYAVVYANGEQVRQRALNENNEWKTTIKAEKQYKYEDGKEIEYEIKESWVKGEVTLEDPNGNYTTIIEGDVENGFTITNTHEVVRVDHTVTIEWDDDDNRDGVRPESVTVYLLRDGERVEGSKVVLNGSLGWSWTWTDLLKINRETGEDAVYSVEADPLDTDEYTGPEVIPSNQPLLFMPLLRGPGSDLSGDGDTGSDLSGGGDFGDDPGKEGESDTNSTSGDGTLLKYTHEPERIDIEGHKIWVDNDNQDGVRPESITLNLYADGEKIDTVELTAEDATDDKNTWAYSFTDLFKYDKGQAIEYVVAEEAVKDYTLSVHGYDIYNTYTPDKTFLTVIKLWDDDRNRDGIRPDNVIVRLLADGEEVSRASISEATGWFIIFDELDVYRPEGIEIEYTIEEDEVEGYKAEITGDMVEGYIVTNVHIPEKVSVTLKTEWIGDSNARKYRPDSVIVHLLANGELVETYKLTEDMDWEMTLENLPKYVDGKEIEYTIAQNPINHYQTSVLGTTSFNKLKPSSCPTCCPEEPTYAIPRTGVK